MKSATYKFTVYGSTHSELVGIAETKINTYAEKDQTHFVYEMIVEDSQEESQKLYTAQVIARIKE
jgi:hypothetical protein